MTATTYPNGQVLTSTALTVKQINAIIQTLTCGVLGINPPDYGLVRVSWQTEGQPFENVDRDVCYVSCVPQDVEYSRVRDRVFSGTGPVVENWLYTKGWRISWCFYGPNGEDRARAVRSAAFMDYFNDQLSLSNLYLVNDPSEITRVPEHFNAQWWERSDFHLVMYEQVTETISDGAATSVEVKVYDKDGLEADINVVRS